MSNSNEKNKVINFCPLCQAPLLFLKISPFTHVASCSVVWDLLPVCPDGKNCLSSNIFHYRDYSHCELAAYRSSNEYVSPSVENFSDNSAKKSPIKSDKKIKISKVKHKGKKGDFNKEKLELKNKVDNSFCNENSDDEFSVFKEDRTNKKKSYKRSATSCSDKNVRTIAKKVKKLNNNSNNSSFSSDVDKKETKDVLLKDIDIDLLDSTGNTVNRDCDISSSSIDIFNDEIKCCNKEDKIYFSQYFNESNNSDYKGIDFVNEQCFTISSPKRGNSNSTPSSPSVSYSPLESDKSSLLCSENIDTSAKRPDDNIVKENENQELSPVKIFNTFKFVPKTERKYKLSAAESNGDITSCNSVQSTRNSPGFILNSQKNKKAGWSYNESDDTHRVETNVSEFCKNDLTVFNIKDGLATARASNDNDSNTSLNKKTSYLTKFQMGIDGKKAETGKGLSLNTKRGIAPKIFEKRDNIEVPESVAINDVDRPSIKSFGQRSIVKKICPFFKRIPDTSFVVDAFQYGYIPGISTYFLTHFHSDHYVGLKKSFSMPIFCSEITANLVKMMIGVNETWLNVIDVGERRFVNGTEVVALEANHCPGSLMFLFQLRTGQNYLHVGDFRFCTEMETYLELQKLHINKLFLDTTYCKPEYDFPAQVDIINKVVNIAKDEVMKNPKLLIVCGSYVIGKEKVFRAIAKECSFNIWAESNKKRVFKCLNYPDVWSRFKNNPSEAQIHVLSMQNVTFEKLGQHLDKHNKYKNIVAFRPTGWALKNSRVGGCINRRVQDRIVIYDVPYSEHSSFSELRRFVQYIKPDEIVPTVNVGSPALRDEMQRYFTSWLSELKQPRQSNILNFLKLSKN